MLERSASPLHALLQTLSAHYDGLVRTAGVLSWPLRRLFLAYRRHRTTECLRSLDSRTLSDIGVERDRIDLIVQSAIDHPSVDPRRLYPRD